MCSPTIISYIASLVLLWVSLSFEKRMVPNQTAASEQMCKLEGYIGRKQLVGSRTSSHAEPLNIELRMSGCKNRWNHRKAPHQQIQSQVY